MDGFLRVFLALLIGVVVAMGIPREIGREFHWQVVWEHSFGPGVPNAPETVPFPSTRDYVPVETDSRFVILDSRTGEAVAGGLKTEVFHASSQAMINQASEAPRWAVQSWQGRMLRVVPRRGAPRLHGATLLQFSEDSMAYGDVVTTGEQWQLELPKNSTVYDLAQDAAGEPWFAVGTLEGTVLLSGAAGSDREWRHTVEVNSNTAAIPPVYGIALAAPESSSHPADPIPPSVYLVHGLDPQVVSRLDFRVDGTTDRVEIAQIPEDHVIRGPRPLFQLEQDLLVTGLNGALLVVRFDDDNVSTIGVPGLLDLSGIGRATSDLVVATGGGRRGALIVSGTENMSSIALWELEDQSIESMVHERSATESVVIVQQDERLLALELTL